MTEDTTIKLGDLVWVAIAKGKRKTIICPDCFGTGQLDVILKDGTTHSIDCRGCEEGYRGPQGTIVTWEYEPSVEAHTVTKIEQDIGSPPEYRAGCSYYKAEDVFLTREDAAAHAVVLAEQQAKDEADKINRKEKDAKTWAWNVHYHRRCIRDAQKNIEYHTSKLNVAKLHVKTDEGEKS